MATDVLGFTQLTMPIFHPRRNVTTKGETATIESGVGEVKHQPTMKGF